MNFGVQPFPFLELISQRKTVKLRGVILSNGNIESFNEATVKILGALYFKHPNPTELDGYDLAEVPNVPKMHVGLIEGSATLTSAESEKATLYTNTIHWLKREGFIRTETYPFYTLTVKGLDLMNKPLALEGAADQTIGESLIQTATSGALGAVSTAVKTIISEFIKSGI